MEKKKNGIFWKSAMYGALRGMPFEHPFETVKTKAQACVSHASVIKTFLGTYRELGIRGIYAGFGVNIVRTSLKHLYRAPLSIIYPQFFADSYPKELQMRFPTINKVSAGVMMALSEFLIVCPLERLKTIKMTAENPKNKFVGRKRRFLEKFKLKKSSRKTISIKYYYNGGLAFLYRHLASWITFMYFDTKLKQALRRHKNMESSKKLSISDIGMISVGTSISNILFVMPFDRLKTIYQMDKKSKHKKTSIIKAMVSICRTEGPLSFYSGWKAQLMQGFIAILFNSYLLEFLENMKNNTVI